MSTTATTPHCSTPDIGTPIPVGGVDRPGRTLVLCCDGTGDSYDEDCTNVAQLKEMLVNDGKKQIVHYQPGIGVCTKTKFRVPFVDTTAHTLDKMFAWTLDDQVQAGYQFLMDEYRPGDEICLFGFSRGAFIARAIAGMVQRIGLLPKGSKQLPSVYGMYLRKDEEGLKEILKSKRGVSIKFIGVWDTVEAVGLSQYRLPFCVSDNTIEYFRHAISLDERRVKFSPTYYHGAHQHEKPGSETCELGLHAKGVQKKGIDVKEVFFAGVHCDVGGGAVKNDERHALARIPLRWMIRECFQAEAGIIFDARALKNEIGLDMDPKSSGPMRKAPKLLSRPAQQLDMHKTDGVAKRMFDTITTPISWMWTIPSNGYKVHWDRTPKGECQEELEDSASPINDRLDIWYWKAMQYAPVIVRNSCESKHWWQNVNCLSSSISEGREMDAGVKARGIKVHRSVKTRMLATPNGKDDQYLPAIHFPFDSGSRQLKREEWLAEPKPKYFEWVDESEEDPCTT